MSKRMEIDEQLRAIVQKKAKREIDFGTTLSEAGLDSLDIIEIGFDVEDKFKVDLPQSQQEMANFTFGDLCRLIEERMADNAGEGTARDVVTANRTPQSIPTSNEAAIDRSLHQ